MKMKTNEVVRVLYFQFFKFVVFYYRFQCVNISTLGPKTEDLVLVR